MQVHAYFVVGNGIMHSSSHDEHLCEPIYLHVSPIRKIPSPNFHPHLMWMK